MLGVCLGAQLIASAMSARVYPNHLKEIGWSPMQAVRRDDCAYFRFPDAIEVFHWHGETFDLPSGAVRLAQSDGCKNQAFQLRKSVIGLQFHLETAPETAREIVANCRAELSGFSPSDRGQEWAPKEGTTSVLGMDSDLDPTSDRPRDVRTLASASRTQSTIQPA
ncbi:MAG: type 1 glutamine amidotransferase [Gammaproteobacteria bacterium]